MDSKGKAIDKVFIERLLFSVKYEYICLNHPDDKVKLYQELKKWLIQVHIDLLMNTESWQYVERCL